MPAASVASYLEALPDERRVVVETVRALVQKSLPPGFEEGIQYGMIGWYVPTSRYPAGYRGDRKVPLPYLGLAAQKSHFGLYVMALGQDPAYKAWFVQAFSEALGTGAKLPDFGKACLRFKKVEELPLNMLAEAFGRVTVDGWIATYEASRG